MPVPALTQANISDSTRIQGSTVLCPVGSHLELTWSDDLREVELVALGSELPEEQRVLLLHLGHGALQWLQGDEHTCRGGG